MKNYLLLFSIILFGFKVILAQSAGSIDYSFDIGSGFNNFIRQILLQPDGKILVIGEFTEFNGAPNNRIIRLNSDGSKDNSFNTGSGFGSSDWISSMVLQPDGKILVAGELSSYNSSSVSPVIRLNSDGTLDNTFDVSSVFGFGDYAQRLLLQSTGKVLVSGSFISGIPSQPQGGNYVIRLDTDGSFDQTFNYQDNVLPRIDNDTIYGIGSTYNSELGGYRMTIVELDPNGVFQPSGSPSPLYYPSPITGGGPGFIGSIYDVAFLPNERMVVVGDFSELFDTSGTTTPRIGIINEGAQMIDSSFNAGTGFNEAPDVIEYDGQSSKILVGGYFNFYQGNAVDELVRLNLDGSLDNSFQTGSGFAGSIDNFSHTSIFSIQIQSDGKIIAAGNFTSYDGVARNNIVRINGGGTTSVSYVPSREVSVFPNPSNGHFRIDVASMEEYRVYDALGKMVCSNANGSTRMIDLSAEPSGIYTLRVKTAHGWATQKLVKQ